MTNPLLVKKRHVTYIGNLGLIVSEVSNNSNVRQWMGGLLALNKCYTLVMFHSWLHFVFSHNNIVLVTSCISSWLNVGVKKFIHPHTGTSCRMFYQVIVIWQLVVLSECVVFIFDWVPRWYLSNNSFSFLFWGICGHYGRISVAVTGLVRREDSWGTFWHVHTCFTEITWWSNHVYV